MTTEPRQKVAFDADEFTVRLALTIPGDVGAIEPTVSQVMGVVRQMRCAGGDEFEIELAVQEALANAIVHGCQQNPEKQVEISVGCDERHGMLIVVRDPGNGFDPAALPSPLVGERLFAGHGRGIYLINRLMDSVRFERGGAEIWMVKRSANASS